VGRGQVLAVRIVLMIDFRYHLVSIVAVFLALSLGLLLGSTELRPYVQKGLQGLSKTEQHQIDTLLGQKQQLKSQISSENQFALANAPAMLDGVLAGQRVVLVLAPGAPDSVTSGVTQALQTAGATVSGSVQLQPAFFDTSAATSQKLTQIAQQYAQPAAVNLAGSAQAQASELIAHVIMTQDQPGQPVPGERDPVSVQTVQALAGGGFLTKSGQPWDRATLAVVIIPATPLSVDDTNPESQVLVTLAQQLNLASLGTVVAGTVSGSGQGSAIDVMRAGGKEGHLTSVDDADYPIGQIVVAQSLAELEHGRNGSYGVTSTASAAGPSPPPSPAPTVSPTTATQGTASGKAGHRAAAGSAAR
jgi:copper transport outer membrane protein MctB